MMRLWVQSYARKQSVAPTVTLSVAAHAILIAAWVVGTMPAANVPPNSLFNRIFYIPPPDKVPGSGPRREVVRYLTLGPEGPGDGVGKRTMGEARPATADETVGRARIDTTTSEAVTPTTVGSTDSVFTVLDVDTAVVRSSSSAAPAYPLKLLQAHVMGSVSARYIVDTTGFADTTSFTVISSTHREFIDAVRDALPYMRFQPAKIGSLKVKQLVEQQFSFKITDTAIVAPRVKKP